MSSIDLTRLSPSDAVAALGSYPRRFRTLVQPVEDEDVDALAARPGPDGRSAVDVVAHVTRTWGVLGAAVREVVVSDTPVLPPEAVDPGQRSWQAPPPGTVSEALLDLEAAAVALVDQVRHVPTESWTRTGTVAGGGAVSALDLVREAVRVGRDGLDQAEAALAAARA